jgi:predicted transcriptional regulator of viral defense system
MHFHEQPYYVGLLSAAAIHGAAHQQPQEFQVLTARSLRPIEAVRFGVRFFVNRRIQGTATMPIKTETGTMLVSTPAATAIDLVRYAHRALSRSRKLLNNKDITCNLGIRPLYARKK